MPDRLSKKAPVEKLCLYNNWVTQPRGIPSWCWPIHRCWKKSTQSR